MREKLLSLQNLWLKKARDKFKVVPGPYMIKLNKRTEVIHVDPEPQSFLKYVYTLTPLEELEEHKNKTDQFLGKYHYLLLHTTNII
jgi:replication factor A1